MDKKNSNSQEVEVRKGPWTMEEDLILINYIANHGEGVWNSLARSAGLKRTGKSCRLRWLNYLRPDVRRGNITPEEQLLIMELHARWGNRQANIKILAHGAKNCMVPTLFFVLPMHLDLARTLKCMVSSPIFIFHPVDFASWSKIARQLPGRTDNEIKNYWRTRIQKQIKQAEPFANRNYDLADSASSSHTSSSSSSGKAVDTYLPAYPPGNQEQFTTPWPTESNDCLWSMEDLLSTQLFNSD